MTTGAAAGILLVDDHKPTARQLAAKVRRYLRFHVELVVAHSVPEARRELLGPHRWVGAIVDYKLPGGDGLDVLAAFRRVETVAPAMLITGYTIDGGLSSLAASLQASALDKGFAGDAIGGFVRYCERVFVEATGGLRHIQDYIRATGLSHREAQVLRRMLRGKTQPEIAAAIGVDARTVETYATRGLKKLGAATVNELAHVLLELAFGDDWFPKRLESA